MQDDNNLKSRIEVLEKQISDLIDAGVEWAHGEGHRKLRSKDEDQVRLGRLLHNTRDRLEEARKLRVADKQD